MKYKMIVLMLALLVSWGVASNVQAQGFTLDPFGIPDTVAFQVTIDTVNNPATMVVELYVFSDSLTMIGATSGFSWEESSVPFTMDSALPSPLIETSFDQVFFYEDNDINITNTNKQFLFGGFLIFNPGVPPDNTGRRLWATYYFTLGSWNAGDSIVFDTLTFNPGSAQLFTVKTSEGQQGYTPEWEGRYVFQFPTDVKDVTDENLPKSFSLQQNYPNPFNPSTVISFDVPKKSKITLTVYNILGQKVTTLVDREMAPGRYEVDWNGKTDGGTEVASGVYFYKIKADSFVETKKMMLVR